MTIFIQIALRIIQEQELVIGPLAWNEAEKVQGLKIIDSKKGKLEFNNGDPKAVVDRLVSQYERLFGRASREACREAVASILPDLKQTEIPSSLR